MILALFAAVAAVFYIVYLRSDRNDYKTRFESERKRVDDLCQKEQAKYDQLCQEAQEKYDALCATAMAHKEYYEKEINEFDSYIKKKCAIYPHLAAVQADLLTAHYAKSAQYLRAKQRPAYVEAQRIDALKKETQRVYEEKKLAEYNLKYILELSPDLKTIFDEKGRIRVDLRHIKMDLDAREKELVQKEIDLNAKEKRLHELEVRYQDVIPAYNELREFENRLCVSMLPVFGPNTIHNLTEQLLTPKFFRAEEEKIFFANKEPITAQIWSNNKPYSTSLTDCTCGDTSKPCKHMVWLASRIGALGLVAKPEQEAFIAKLRPTLKEIQQARDELQKEKEANKRVLAQIKKATAETTASAT